MDTAKFAADHFASVALIDSVAAELIDAGMIDGDRLADRIEAAASGHPPARQEVLLALASGLRGTSGPVLTLIDGGRLSETTARED